MSNCFYSDSSQYDELIRSVPDDAAAGRNGKIAALPTDLSPSDASFFRGIAEIDVSFDSFTPEQVSLLQEANCSLTPHQKKVLAWERNFFYILSTDPKTAPLSRTNPVTGDREFYRYFAHKTDTYIKVSFNNVMKLYIILTLNRLDGRMYQPGTVMTRVKGLFGLFRTCGIQFSPTKDFNFPGEFAMMLKGLWKKQNKKDITFGCRPNRKILPPEYGQLVRKAVFDGLVDASGDDPYELVLLFGCSLGTMFGFRGEEVSVTNVFFSYLYFVPMTYLYVFFITGILLLKVRPLQHRSVFTKSPRIPWHAIFGD